MVFNLCLSYLQNKDLAEEVTQDVFLTVYQKAENFKANSSIKTWIYRITINKCLDHIKASKRKKRFGFLTSFDQNDGTLDQHLWNMDHPGVQLEDREALTALMSLINQLPDTQKSVLILRAIDGLSPKETAEVMKKSVKAIDSIYSRAKKNLKKSLDASKD